jgi:hypothetical protein
MEAARAYVKTAGKALSKIQREHSRPVDALVSESPFAGGRVDVYPIASLDEVTI